MSARLQEHKLKIMLENEAKYDFPDFIKKIRKAAGKSGELVAKETKIAPRTLSRFESGDFVNLPKEKISTLAKYYKIPKKILVKKCEEFLAVKALDESRRHMVLRKDDEDYDRRRPNQSVQTKAYEEIWKNASIRPSSQEERTCQKNHFRSATQRIF